ncbi:MAG: CmpA/NrtA family ABC transporter substrate-binding protein [Pseudomonadota bacterium]
MDVKRTVTAGFLPLTDCMILAIAREKGFASQNGIDLILSKEQSWASIRDHMAVGHYDVAHLLAPMPIAFNTKLAPFSVPVFAPMALGLGGNAVTLSNAIWDLALDKGATEECDPSVNGKALKVLIEEELKPKNRTLRVAVVHPFSGHNLELRYWFSACGINPDTDVEILVVPPPLMPDALASGRIDGYCVGEPWNSVSVESGIGKITTTKAAIWHSSPEKVLGVQVSWAEQNPDLLDALLVSLFEAAKWCGQRSNQQEIAEILSKPAFIGVPASTILPALSGNLSTGPGKILKGDDIIVPFDRAATFPWQSHALWFYSQMVRWGQIQHSEKNAEIARNSYRPDLYRRALMNTNAAVPAANMKVEGALEVPTAVGSTGRLMLGPDGFFDDRIFDPDKLDEYIADFDRG